MPLKIIDRAGLSGRARYLTYACSYVSLTLSKLITSKGIKISSVLARQGGWFEEIF